MNIPEGMNSNLDDFLLLTKTIYGLVQSAREFYKKLISVLKSIGFKKHKSDPCLLSKWDHNNIIIIGVYVDDCLVIGKETQISQLIVELKENGFNLKIENNHKDYLSCRAIEDKKRILILQPHLINNLQAKFGNEVEKKRVYKTPGTPRFKIPLMGICKANTILVLVCSSISQNILDLICAMWLENCLNVLTKPQWALILRCCG
jgi:Reverse transcriptase (RNA-dependent DNA polymerase)